MKLVASVILRNELDRYLVPFLAHLLPFVDEVRVLDDGSTDDWADALYEPHAEADFPYVPLDRIHVLRSEESGFWQHEGNARQALLDWTLEADPDWVLAIDADEFVSDGPALRALAEESHASVLTLNMQEVWAADVECLCIREDGGWREHPVPILWRVPGPTVLDADRRKPFPIRQWRIPDRQLAPGREPQAVRDFSRGGRHGAPSVDILHFGWACEADRQARYQRYIEHDGGRFHNSAHLQSIMAPPARVLLEGRDWPESLPLDVAARVLARAQRPAADAATLA